MDLPAVKAPDGHHYALCRVIMTRTIDKRKEVIKVLFMTTLSFPLDKPEEVGKVFIELQKSPLPAYVNMMGPYVTFGGEGAESHVFYDVEKGHEEEGLALINRRLISYRGIVGMKITVQPTLPVAEALALLGL